jgi:hypothetical protein
MSDQNKPSIYSGWFEPESAANTDFQPEYRYNHVTQTPRGHVLEMDDTPGRERIRLTHRANSFIEFHPNGDVVHKIFGDGYEITVGDRNVMVNGVCNITINGDCNMHVLGDKVETIEGNYEQHIKGNFTQTVEKTSTITSAQDMRITAGATALGTLTITTGDALIMNGDISTSGEVVAQKITSRSRVDAVTGMSAGALGFVTMTGGVAVGIPIAAPGQVLVSGSVIAGGTVDAAGSVNSPAGNFGVMEAVMMTDQINTAIYDSHIHISPKGPTGPPSPGPMV